MLTARPATGMLLAAVAIAASATLPVHQLLMPTEGQSSLYRFADDVTVTLEGVIAHEPERVGGGRTYLYIRSERAGDDPAHLTSVTGVVRVTIRGDQRFRVGDEVRVTSRIRFPRNDGDEGEFDYRGWLLRKGVAATMFADQAKGGRPAAITTIGHRRMPIRELVEAVRDHIGSFIDANLAYPQNAEMRALLIGDRSGIDEAIRQRFARTGMAHVLVISGLHLGFVAAAAFLAMRWLMGFFPELMARGIANKLGAAAAAIAAATYTSIAGGHISTLRALVMVVAYTFAIVIDRSRELLASLALAALIICFAIPGSTADIGFQLSFASVTVILAGMRRFTAWWRLRNPAQPEETGRRRTALVAEAIAGAVAVSFWALLGTAPLTAFHFNQFSLIGLIANAVVVPITGFGAVISGLFAAGLSFLWPPGARLLIVVAGSLAAIGNALAGWFAEWPLAWTRTFTPTIPELAIAYGFIALWLARPLAAHAGPEHDLNGRSRTVSWRYAVATALLFSLIADAGWWIYQRYLFPDLRVDFLSVGQGDAAVIRFPGGRVMLIDGGGSFFGTFDPGERIVAPFLWANKIMRVDIVAVSHPDRDHFGGLDFLVRNFSPSEFWTSGIGSADESYNRLLETVALNRVRVARCGSASAPRTIGRVGLSCLWPPVALEEQRDNNDSMVLRLDYRGIGVLFTGDLEAKGERELITSGANLKVAIVKVPHHGSATSSSAAMVDTVRPKVAVISDGYHNRFRFPSGEVIERYREAGATVLRTDLDGAVHADIGRDGVSISTWRSGRPMARLPAGP